MAILAHRGITAVARDNSIDAIRAVAQAARSGLALGIEVDIRRTPDCLVLNHDPSEDGLTLATTSLAALRASMGPASPATLASGLEEMAPIPLMNLEIKDAGCTEEVIALATEHVRRHGKPFDSVLISSFVPEVVAEAKDMEPRFTTALLVDEDPLAVAVDPADVLGRVAGAPSEEYDAKAAAMLSLLDDVKADLLNPPWASLSAELMRGIGARRRRLAPWTVNNEALLVGLARHADVAHVITDFPDMVFTTLRPAAPASSAGPRPLPTATRRTS